MFLNCYVLKITCTKVSFSTFLLKLLNDLKNLIWKYENTNKKYMLKSSIFEFLDNRLLNMK